jgi:integrase
MGVIVREKQKGSGEWWIFINHNGKRRSKKIGDKATANKVAKEVRERFAKGDLGMLKNTCPVFSSYGQDWLNSPLRELEDSTRKMYDGYYRLHIKPHLGSKRLDEIKRRHIKRLISLLKEKGLSSASIQGVIAVLSGIFENAIEDEIVSANPCQNTRKYCGNEPVIAISTLTPSEVQTMLENASKLPVEVYTFYLVSVRTGIRVGEMLALEWSDIDFDNRLMEVSKSYNINTKKVGQTKNKKMRKVDLTPATVAALQKLRKDKRVLGIKLVFSNSKGKRVNYRRLVDILKKIAPRQIRIHDLRHTYATLRVAKGDNILDVSRQLGHHSVAFTIDKYAHWMPGEHKSQIDELDSLHLTAP